MIKQRIVCLFIVFILAFGIFTPIPTAAKSYCQTNGWEVLYTLEFSPSYWTAGWHTNDLITTDSSGINLTSFSFLSTEDVPVYPGQVRIGFWGIHSIYEGGLNAINPAQDTFMQASQTNFITREDAKAYADSAVVQFSWDGGAPVTVSAGPVNCAPDAWSGQNGYYHRDWGSN